MFGRTCEVDEEPIGIEETVEAAEAIAPDQAPESDEPPSRPGRRPWWRRLGSLVLEMCVIVALAAGIPPFLSWALHTQYPLAAITSSSMWPVLERGDLVVVKGLDGDTVETGQIIVYRNSADDTMVIHRVFRVEGSEIVTKGDANSEPDEPITINDVTGVVPMIGDSPMRIPYLGRVTLIANSRY